MLEATHEETKNVKWIQVDSWFDYMLLIQHKVYVSADGKFGKDVDEDGYEEIYKFD